MTDRPGEMDERDVDQRFASIVAAWEGHVPGAPHDPPGGTDEVDDGTHPSDSAGGDADTPPDPEGADTRQPAEEDAEGHEPPERPPWVNPSPLDLVVPASTWRAPTSPSSSASPPDTGAGAMAPDDDDHFEPPPVTLPPQEDLHFWGAVVGLVAGPLMLLWVALARPFHSERWFTAGVVLSLVGFGLLVLRQPRHRDPSDGDDGARV